jgi:hypothetical protein
MNEMEWNAVKNCFLKAIRVFFFVLELFETSYENFFSSAKGV